MAADYVAVSHGAWPQRHVVSITAVGIGVIHPDGCSRRDRSACAVSIPESGSRSMATDDQRFPIAISLLRAFTLQTGATDLSSDGGELLTWLDRKIEADPAAAALADRYREWLADYLRAIAHPAALAIAQWRKHPVDQGKAPVASGDDGIASGNQSGPHMRCEGMLRTFTSETGQSDIGGQGELLLEWLSQKVLNAELSQGSAKCYRRWFGSYYERLAHPAATTIRSWVIPPVPTDPASPLSEARQIEVLEVAASDTNTQNWVYADATLLKLLMQQLVETTESSGQMRYQDGDITALLLRTTAMTGLRPVEWASAKLLTTYHDHDSGQTLGPVLEVHTAKQSNRREDNPLKPKRHLLLDLWPADQIRQLEVMLEYVDTVVSKEGEEAWTRYMRRIREQLSRAWPRLVKRLQGKGVGAIEGFHIQPAPGRELSGSSFTLYTCRHIFAEEVRRSGAFDRYELAALLGHSLITNSVYYGPRSKGVGRGHQFVLPRPWPGDADEILKWDHQVNPLSAARRKGGISDEPSVGALHLTDGEQRLLAW